MDANFRKCPHTTFISDNINAPQAQSIAISTSVSLQMPSFKGAWKFGQNGRKFGQKSGKKINTRQKKQKIVQRVYCRTCLLYTSDAADE